MSDRILCLQDGGVHHSLVVSEIVRWAVEHEYQSNITTVYLRNGSCVKFSYDVTKSVETAVSAHLDRKLLSPVEDRAI